MRNTPEAKRCIDVANTQGVKAAVIDRDGPWGDYSQAPAHEKPDPNNAVALATPRNR